MKDDQLAMGIDIGTSGVRVITTTAAGTQISLANAETATPLNRPANWWNACQLALRGALADIDSSTVVAIAVDGTSGTLLAIDTAGNPIGDALMYHQGAADSAIHLRLCECVPVGNPAASATSGLAKAIALQQRPGVSRVIHQADWLMGMLTADYSHSDENNALKSGYDPVQRHWPNWISDAGMNPALLPEVHPVATPITTVCKPICDEFGLLSSTMVYTGTTDGCASFLATGASQNGEAVSALGTTLTLKQLVSKPVFDANYGVYSHRIGDLWLAGGASNTGGAVLDHYFTRDELVFLSASINTSKLTNLAYYPLLNKGERFPINNPSLEPAISPRPENDSEFLQGLFEGIAKIEKLGFERVYELSGTQLTSIRTVGGGAANKQWTQLRQHILGVPFESAESVQAAAGTARLAWRGHCQS